MLARPLVILLRVALLIAFAVCLFTTAAQAQVSINFQGHVKYSTGEPVVGATVVMTVRYNGSTVSSETASTDGSGNYAFQSSRSLPPCNPNEWLFQADNDEVVDDEALPPSQVNSSSGCVGPGTVTIGDLIIARPHPIILGGIVRDSFGTPTQGLTITMTRTKYDLNPPVVTTSTTVTDENGHYQFSTYSRCSVVEEFKASIGSYIFQGGVSTSGCVLSSNDSLDFTIGLWPLENAGFPGCKGVGKPVNVTNGNTYLQQADYQLPGAGESIAMVRSYNSIVQAIGLFGRGWTSVYDETVSNASGLLQLTLADGRLVSALTPNFFGQIVQNGDGTYTVTFKSGYVHRFNTSGKLTSLSDRNGNQTTLTYNGSGRLASVTDAFGRVLTINTNASGRVSSISDSLGTIATYSYGGSQQLLSVSYADNSGYQFAYTSVPAGLALSSVTDMLGNVIEQHAYDSQGRATTSEAHGGAEHYTLNYVSATETDVTDGLGRVTKYFYHNIKASKTVVRVEGLCGCGGGGSQVRTWTYDDYLNVTSMTDALGHVTTRTFDAKGNPLTITDPTGTATNTYNQFSEILTNTNQLSGITTNTYDTSGNLLTTEDALNNTTTITYDTHGEPLTITDARGKTTTFDWDTNGRLTQSTDALDHTTIFGYDARARLTSVTNALNETTNYEYDLAGRPKKVIYADANFITFTYDLAGRRTKITDARGHDTNFGFDSAYRLTSVTDALNHATSYGYDVMSNLTSMTDALSHTTDYEYDDFNRLKKITYPAAETGATRLFETIAYDADGNVTSRVDTAGRITSYGYDDANRLTSTTNAANETTAFEYDALSRITSLTDALNQQYQFGYDALGRQTEITRADATMSYVYDEVGNRIQRTDYNGAVTNYTYDDLNRLTQINYPDFTSASYAYDSLSRLTAATNQNGTVSFAYDNRGRVSSTTDVWGKTVGYSYDAAGNRTAMTVGGSVYATYVYDAVNRLSQITDANNQVVSHSYDVTNKLVSRGLPNGITANYSYDGLTRLTQLRYTKGGDIVTDNQYTYDEANQIAAIDDSLGTREFAYDPVDRLLAVTGATGERYSYDEVGNRTGVDQDYTYEAFNRLVYSGVFSHTYDDNGNELSKHFQASGADYLYDSENRLATVTLTGSLSPNFNNTHHVYYKYDALGRRIERSNDDSAERFVYDGQNVVQDLDGSNTVVATYLNGPGIDDKIRQNDSANGNLYFIADHLGSTRALTDNSGNVAETIDYDSFGNSTGSALTRYTYTGREFDADTGLYYYRARWYDPQVGRFMSEDPSRFNGGQINLYSYVRNNPTSFIDPSGLELEGFRWNQMINWPRAQSDCACSGSPIEVIIWNPTDNDIHGLGGHVSYSIDGYMYSWEAGGWHRPHDTSSDYLFRNQQYRSGQGYVLDFGSPAANAAFIGSIKSAYDGNEPLIGFPPGLYPYNVVTNNCGAALSRAAADNGLGSDLHIAPGGHERFIEDNLGPYIKERRYYPQLQLGNGPLDRLRAFFNRLDADVYHLYGVPY